MAPSVNPEPVVDMGAHHLAYPTRIDLRATVIRSSTGGSPITPDG